MHTPSALPSPLHLLAVVFTVAVVLLSAACGSAAPPTSTVVRPRPSAPVDRLVPIGSGRLHLRCAGRGDTTVLLLPGWGDGGDNWGEVETRLREHARVCTYARFGTGTSDPPPSTQTFVTQATDLQRLLDAAGEVGPYVVVGHSFGGAEAVTFASRHRDEVRGLALLDTSPMTWPHAVCAVPNDGSDMAAVFRATCDQMTDAAANPERLDAVRAFDDVATTPSLGALPMVVITRADPEYAGLDDATTRMLAAAWTTGQDRWAALSTTSRVVPMDTQEHDVHHVDPELVVREIRSLLGHADSI